MTAGEVLVVAYEVERGLFRVVLAAFVIRMLAEAWVARRGFASRAPAAPASWPSVTVQIPLRDEYYVAERVIRAVAAQRYAGALDIQVLDDSSDDTRAVVDRVAGEVRALGIAIEVIRRDRPTGAKAGALAAGLATARGEFVCVFDADCIPEPDFLARAVPYFDDERIAMVQGRWDYTNRDESLLSRAQSLLLDGLMLVEQPARALRGQPLHFNGTAGVWRRAAIEDAGGWRDRSITEDLELSYRAVRRGWRLVHVAALAVPTELPHTMRAFRAQQRRWTRGNAQVVRAAWLEILRAPIPLRARLAMLARAGSRVLYLFLAVLTVMMPLTTFGAIPWLVDYSLVVDSLILGVVVLALIAFYVPAQRRATGSALRGLAILPLSIALHVGLSISCAASFLAGLVVRDAAFVRTPKRGDQPTVARYRLPIDPAALLEVAIGFAYAGFAVLAIQRGLYPFAVFFALWGAAHAWTGIATITGRD